MFSFTDELSSVTNSYKPEIVRKTKVKEHGESMTLKEIS